MNLLYIDLFCGAGGVTTGISQVPGVHVVACVNHDADAIASHAANHPRTLHYTENRQREDYYATDPDMVRDLLNAGAPLRQRVWEPACGAGHIVNVLRERGHEVCATDIVDRGCPDSCVQDFLWEFDDGEIGDVDIMTNPPYATALEFVERALACVKNGANVWMLLRLQFLEGKARRRLYDVAPPADVWVFSERRTCAKNGDFSKTEGGAIAYAWFHWVKGYNNQTIVKWL